MNDMINQETRYQNSAHLMDEALIELLKDKDIEFITIKEICHKAGVNRSTFYLHYETIDDLLKECVEWVMRNFYSYFKDVTLKSSYDINNIAIDKLNFISKEYLIPYLTFIKDNKSIMIATVSRNNISIFKSIYKFIYHDVVLNVLSRFNISNDDAYYFADFYFNGIAAIINRWIKNNFKESIEKVADLIIMMVPNTNK